MKWCLILTVVGVVSLALVTCAGLEATGLLDGYNVEECQRLETLVADELLRDELTRWVDTEVDLESLVWSDTGGYFDTHSGNGPGNRFYIEPNFDWSILGFTPKHGSHWPEVWLIVPEARIRPPNGTSRVFANTKSIVFVQINRTAILVRTKTSEDFGVNPEHFKRVEGRVAVYCEPRD